jgi:hypothetical protein
MSHWSSGLPVCFPSNPQGGTYVKLEYLLLALSRYIGDPDVIRSLASSPLKCFTRLHADLITQLLFPGFTLATGFPSSVTTDGVGCRGEPCGEPAISLHSHHVSLVQLTTRLLPIMRDPGSNPQGGYLYEIGISPVSIVSLHYHVCCKCSKLRVWCFLYGIWTLLKNVLTLLNDNHYWLSKG